MLCNVLYSKFALFVENVCFAEWGRGNMEEKREKGKDGVGGRVHFMNLTTI